MSDIIQGSPEWFEIRRGKITASRVHDILHGKNGYKAARGDYLAEKVTEILTGKTEDTFTSEPMQWGIDTEPEARAAYEVETGVFVDEVGFNTHPNFPFLGYSADGEIEKDGGLEIKCPKTKKHMKSIMFGKIDPQYMTQIQVSLLCSGRKWWDFVSYDPRLNPKNRLFIKRILPDKEYFERILFEVKKFKEELDIMVEKLS